MKYAIVLSSFIFSVYFSLSWTRAQIPTSIPINDDLIQHISSQSGLDRNVVIPMLNHLSDGKGQLDIHKMQTLSNNLKGMQQKGLAPDPSTVDVNEINQMVKSGDLDLNSPQISQIVQGISKNQSSSKPKIPTASTSKLSQANMGSLTSLLSGLGGFGGIGGNPSSLPGLGDLHNQQKVKSKNAQRPIDANDKRSSAYSFIKQSETLSQQSKQSDKETTETTNATEPAPSE